MLHAHLLSPFHFANDMSQPPYNALAGVLDLPSINYGISFVMSTSGKIAPRETDGVLSLLQIIHLELGKDDEIFNESPSPCSGVKVVLL